MAYATAMQRARADPSIDAVVLLVNSPGGTASASETMYLETLRTAEVMPVVASVDATAASGAYYTAVSSDYIYAKPSSLVGSVGVLFTPPPEIEPTDQVAATGPSKLAGNDERGWYYNTEALKQAFLGAVVEQREANLTIPPSQVGTAELFSGARAVENGLADDIGGTRTAVAKAASMAGLASYDVRVIRPQDQTRFITRSNYLASDASNKTLTTARYFVGTMNGSGFPNYLMLPPGVVRTAMVRDDAIREPLAREESGQFGASDGSGGGADSGESPAGVNGTGGGNASAKAVDPGSVADPGPPAVADPREVRHGLAR